jgi:large subunit ribosomal protein L22
MAFGVKTNERPGTRAQVRYSRMSATKAREVLDLVRGKHVHEADAILEFSERDSAIVIRKCLASAVSNARVNDEQDPESLYVSACYADEGPTLKRWRPRARGRATRIRKRTCHITVIVSRMDDETLQRWQEQQAKATPAAAGRARRRGGASADRRARVAKSRAAQAEAEPRDDAEDEAAESARRSSADDASQIGEAGPAEQVESSTDIPGEPTEETIEAVEEAAETEAEATESEESEEIEAEQSEVEEDPSAGDAAQSARRSSDEGDTRIGEAGPEEPATEDD